MMDRVNVVNADAAMRIEGVVDLQQGSNPVEAEVWDRAKANPLVRLYLETGRLKEGREKTTAEDPPAGDEAARRKRARG